MDERFTAPVELNVAIWRLPVPVAFEKVKPWKDEAPFVTVRVEETVSDPLD